MLAVSSEGYLASGHTDGTVRLWQAKDWHNDSPASPTVLAGYDAPVTAMAFTPDGQLVSGADDGSITMWSLTGGGQEQIVPGVGAGIAAVACTPGGGIVAGRHDGLVWIGDVQRKAADHVGQVNAMAVAADGQLAVGYQDGSVQLRVTADEQPRIIGRHSGAVTAVAFAQDGRLATGASDGEVRVWDAEGQFLHSIVDQAGPVTSVGFAPDGRLAIACGGLVRIWPYGTAPSELIARAARYERRPLTSRQRELVMLTPATDDGR